MMRPLVAAAVLTTALVGLTACGDDESDPPTTDADPVTVLVTFEGDTVDPSGDRVEVETGQPVELEITADTAGEIHVHSDPEQTLSYDAGSSTVQIEGIDQPGVVEVESHNLDKVIVQLEVS